MHALEITALAAVAIWLAVLTVLALLILRQVGLLTAWMQQRSPILDDGLDAGTPVPEEALEVMPELKAGVGYVLFLAGNCGPCREFAFETGRSETISGYRENAAFLAAVAGEGKQVDEIVELLPSWVRVVRGSAAEAIRDDFLVKATPAVYEVEFGNVTGRAVAGYGVTNFENLIAARADGSNAPDFAGQQLVNGGGDAHGVTSGGLDNG